MIRFLSTGAPGRLPNAVLALAALAFVPAPAVAEWIDFLPRPLEKHAWLEVDASWERDKSSGTAKGVTWEDTFLREKLLLESSGYSYDPRFLLYRLSVGGAVKQELYESSAYRNRGWQIDEGIEYDARLVFLPEHAYGATASASRYEPVYRQQSSVTRGSVAEDYRVGVRYTKKPWFFDASFLDSKVDSIGTDSDILRVRLDGEYFRRFTGSNEVSVSGSYAPSWYQDSNGLDGDSSNWRLGNTLRSKRARLTSSVTQDIFDQTRDDTDRYDTDQFNGWELLSVDLPWNFRTDVSYRHRDDDSTVDDGSGGDPERRYKNDGDNVQADLIHRLYESLDSRYRFVWDSRDSTGGSTELLSHGLNLDYSKSIPWGRFLAGTSLGRSDMDNSGFGDVVGDSYSSTAVPGTFTLRQTGVDVDSIVVFLRSPLPPFGAVELVEGVHYVVNTAVEPFEVQMIALPDEFAVPGSYEFVLNYSLLSGDYELRTDYGGASVSLDLFDNLVSPYFRYLAQRTDVLRGVYPGYLVDSDNYTAGLRLLYGPWRGRVEYQLLEWYVRPYRAVRTEAQYVGEVTRTLTAYATVAWLNRHYSASQAPYTQAALTEDIWTLSGTLTKEILPRDLTASVGGSWSHLSGLTDSDAWSANSSLTWHIGRLDIGLSVTAFGSNSKADYRSDFERDHEYVAITIRRQLL